MNKSTITFFLFVMIISIGQSGCSEVEHHGADVDAGNAEVLVTKVHTEKYWRPSDDLKTFIKTMENKPLLDGETELVEYDDVGHIAKGYGTKAYLFTEEGNSKEAERIMVYKLFEANGFIDKYVTHKLNNHERNALVSLIYNVGRDGFRNSAAFKALNKGDIKEFKRQAFDPIVGFVCADGKYNKGLINRRAHELVMWEEGVYEV